MELNAAAPKGAGEEAAPESTETGRRRKMIGRVVSDKMDKTVVVEVTRTVKHGRYHKFVTRRKKYHAHDEANECKVDDTVVIQESRPLSKTKHWIVIERRTA